MQVTAKMRADIRARFKAGEAVKDIAASLGVCNSTVYRYARPHDEARFRATERRYAERVRNDPVRWAAKKAYQLAYWRKRYGRKAVNDL